MKRKNLFKLGAAFGAAALCTVVAGVGVWAASQDTLVAGDNIAFVADPWVSATVSDGTNNFTFVDTDTTDDNQTGTIVSIADAGWTKVAGTINETASITFTITNTSTVSDNILTYAISNDWAVETSKCTVAIDNSDADSKLSVGESATIKYTFTADGRYDFAQDVSWTFTLTATR